MAERLYVIDGHSHLYRAFYAIRGLATRDGRPSNAVFGFTAMLRKLVNDHRPDYLAVAFDRPGPTFRHARFEGYKANREAPPEEFSVQIPMTEEVLRAMGIPIYAADGYEADDVLGTLTRAAREKGLDVVLVTGDKDAAQLLDDHVAILDTKKDQLLTAATLRERDGITPEQVVDVMALAGDSTDNVPGIPKVGPKTALKLIREYGSLDSVLAHAEEIKPRSLGLRIKEHADLARLSKELVTIDTHAPVSLDLERCRFRPPEPERLRPVFERLNFRQFLEELPAPATEERADYRLVDTPELFEDFLARLRERGRFSIDLETTSASPRAAEIVGLSFSWREREAWYVAVRGPLGTPTLNTETVLEALRPILTDPRVEKVGQNIKYDMVVLRNYGIGLEGVVFDTMLAAYVLDADRRSYSLDALAADYLGYRMTRISDLIGKGKKQITMDLVPVERVKDYACADADITLRLSRRLERDLRAEPDLWKLYNEVELPLASVLAEMEHQGIGFDPATLTEMSAWLGQELARLEKRIHAEAGEAFNVASPRQLAAILFEKLGLPKTRRTKTGASTNSEVLEQLASRHPLPGLVLEYRQLSKLKSTYVDALPQMVLPETGRIHTSFHQTGTSTGRLSSSDPNLQNIPIRTEIGERIRAAFVPSEPGMLLLSADYSQIELRIVAHMSGDRTLREAFARDQDIHRFVAAQINDVSPEDVTPEMRRAAKAVNFGIIYGLTAHGLARDLRVSTREAQRFIEAYFSRYPGVKEFISATIARAHRDGYVRTLCGRRRPLPGLSDPNHAVRQFAERAAVNAVVQGTAADMIKIAMIRIHRRLRELRLRARMILQIHDELLLELPPEEKETVGDLVAREMSGALRMDVPVRVNVAFGRNWMEAK